MMLTMHISMKKQPYFGFKLIALTIELLERLGIEAENRIAGHFRGWTFRVARMYV